MKKLYLPFVLFLFFVNSLVGMGADGGDDETSRIRVSQTVNLKPHSSQCVPGSILSLCMAVDVVTTNTGTDGADYCTKALNRIRIATNGDGNITFVDLRALEELVQENIKPAALTRLLAHLQELRGLVDQSRGLVSELQAENDRLKMLAQQQYKREQRRHLALTPQNHTTHFLVGTCAVGRINTLRGPWQTRLIDFSP